MGLEAQKGVLLVDLSKIPLKRIHQYVHDMGRITTRLACEPLYCPMRYDAAYLPGLSAGMLESCKLLDLFADVRADFHAFNGDGLDESSPPTTGWSGAYAYRQKLLDLGIPENVLAPTGPGAHTRSECDELIKLACERGWKTIAIVSVPYHYPRMLACLVGSMKKFGYTPAIYFIYPEQVDWDQQMVGSQGTNQHSTFLTEAGDDAARTMLYWHRGQKDDGMAWVEGYGAPANEMVDYLRWRDQQH